jgi:hypothetical protein
MHTTTGAGTEIWASFRLPSFPRRTPPIAKHCTPGHPSGEGRKRPIAASHTPLICTQWHTHLGGGERVFCADTQTDMLAGLPASTTCVQRFDDSRVLQFTLRIAFRCVLHRCGSQDILRHEFYSWFFKFLWLFSVLGFRYKVVCLSARLWTARVRTMHTARNHRKSHTHTPENGIEWSPGFNLRPTPRRERDVDFF